MGTAVLALRVTLAAVFAVAGVGKLRDLDGSRRAIRDFGVPAQVAGAVGIALPLVELVVAAALLFPDTARWGAIAALVLLLAFMAGIANLLRQGLAPDCHCFGQIHSAPAGRGTLGRNALLAAMAAVVVVEAPGPAVDAWVGDRTAAELAAVGLGIAATLLALYVGVLRSRLARLYSDLTRAQRYALSATPGVPIGSVAPRFNLPTLVGGRVSLDELRESGRPVLLFFMSPSCDSCVELLPNVVRWQSTLSERLAVAVISTGDVKQNERAFAGYDLDPARILLQEPFVVSDAYRIRGTPSAVLVTAEGAIGSNPAETVFAIEPLIRLALRDGAGAQTEHPVA